MTSLRALALVLLTLACGKAPPVVPDPYAYREPPHEGVAEALRPPTWDAHLREDLLPYWTMAAAKGTPAGNFPTWRDMNGAPASNTARKPRMLGRQTFTYAMAYALTGDESLLELARAGNRWLLDHARDTNRGGWYADLDAAGAQLQDNAKFAQDFSYTAMGPAAFFYVTGDAESEAAVLATRDLLFDPAKFWDQANGRIKDGLDGALAQEKYMDQGGPRSWQLVAQLDPVTAFLLLVQPALHDRARRDQVLGDLRTLALRLHDSFWQDGIFWGATGYIGYYHTFHTDFGHTLKAYWALLQIDKRLADHPLHDFLEVNAQATLDSAYDPANGRWAKQPRSRTLVDFGSDWWAAAEADQLAATLAMNGKAEISTVTTTSSNFRADFVDRTRPARELVSSVNRDGSWAYPWQDGDTAKCNEWKSGFHGVEHALVMSLFGHWVTGTPAPLYFAFPADRIAELSGRATPYTFQGHVAKVEDLGPLAAEPSRHKVRITFDQLH